MDDASKIQQINNVARELMRHGQASTLDEAMRKAQAQVDMQTDRQPAPPVSLNNPVSVAPEQTPDVKIKPASEPTIDIQTPQEIPQAEPTNNSENLQVIHNMVNEQQTIIGNMVNAVNTNTQNIQAFDTKVNALISDLAEVKDKLDKLLNSPTTPPLNKDAVTGGQTQFKQEQPIQTPAEKSEGDASGHARSGNYESGDVSIEKMFYCGPK